MSAPHEHTVLAEVTVTLALGDDGEKHLHVTTGDTPVDEDTLDRMLVRAREAIHEEGSTQ